MKKRILSLFTASAMVLALASCAENSNQFAEFKIERVDASYSINPEEGRLDQYYDKVVLDPVNEKYKNINSLIQGECDAFLADAEENKEKTREALQINRYASRTNCAAATVMTDANGILSIRVITDYYFGERYTINCSGLNYDLTTGEVLQLTKVFSMSEDEIEKYFKEQTKSYMTERFQVLEDADETVEAYTLDEFNYYIASNNVYLCFPAGELTDRDVGIVKVPCPIKTAE